MKGNKISFMFGKKIVLMFISLMMTFVVGETDSSSKKEFLNTENITFTNRASEEEKANPKPEDNVISNADRQTLLRFIDIKNGKASLQEEDLFYACDEMESNVTEEEIDFVCENIDVANQFVDAGFGYLDEQGEFHATNIDQTFTQQEDLISNFHFNIFTGWFFHMSKGISVTAAILGVAANLFSFVSGLATVISLASSMSSLEYKLLHGLETLDENGLLTILVPDLGYSMAHNLTSLLCTCTSNLNLNLFYVVSMFINALALVTCVYAGIQSSGTGWILSLISTVIAIYTPNVITGMRMIIEGFASDAGADANIGYLWSSYSLCYGC